MAVYRNDCKMVEKSKPLTLLPMKSIDDTDISEFDPVRGGFEMRENSTDGLQNTNHKNVMKRRVRRNGTTNSIMNNTLIVHGAIGVNSHEIKQVKRLSFNSTKVVLTL